MKRSLLTLALCSVATSALAEEENKLATDIEFGFISSTGNTETDSLKGQLDVKQNLDSVRNHFTLKGFYKRDKQTFTDEDGNPTSTDRTTANRYSASAQTDLKLNQEHKGLFLYGQYQIDEFSGYNYQGTFALGYSDRLFKYDNTRLTYSVGPGLSFSETEETYDTDGNIDQPSVSETNGIVRVALDFLYQFSENAKFTQTVSSDLSMAQDKNTKTEAETAITATLIGGLAMKASYNVNHNTHVPLEKKHFDAITSVTLVLSF